jgi:hypothetical protein
VRSSNSSARERGPFWYLSLALDAIEKETPVAYRLVAGALRDRPVAIGIGDEHATLSMASGGHHLSVDGGGACAVELRLTEAVVGRLLEGRCTLVDVVVGGELVLRGSADDLAALHDALLGFIKGAVRSPSTPRLLEAYLAGPKSSNGRTRSSEANHGERNDLPQR